jgi:hypothetical protein
MIATSTALEHLLCAVGDRIGELRAIGPKHPEFVRAQTIRAAAGVLAKAPDAFSRASRVKPFAGGVRSRLDGCRQCVRQHSFPRDDKET